MKDFLKKVILVWSAYMFLVVITWIIGTIIMKLFLQSSPTLVNIAVGAIVLFSIAACKNCRKPQKTEKEGCKDES